MTPLDVPAVVRKKATAAGAELWLERLPELVAALQREWSIRVGSAFPDATEAFVAEATRADGSPAVLKLLVPRGDDVAAHEIAVLRLAGGDGCAQLLADDARRGAMLLERLGPSMYHRALPMARRHDLLAAAASRLWRPADIGLPTGAAKAEWLATFICSTWESLGRPCSERAIAHAVDCAERRRAAHDDERAVVVHGDVHQWNALDAGDGTFKLVDPDGLLAEAEYDLGIIMREDPEDLLAGDPRQRSRRLAGRTGLDEAAIWEWGVVERVSTGLLGTEIGMQPVARLMLAVADRVAAMPQPD